MSPEQIKAVLQILLYDSNRDTNLYIVPSLALKNDVYPLTEKEFESYCEVAVPEMYKLLKPGVITFDNMVQAIGEITYDGKGFYIPVLQTYIGARAENQTFNDVKYDSSGNKIEYYNYFKDKHFRGFIQQLFNHMNDLKSWITDRKNYFQNHIKEFTSEINTDDTGLKLMADPYIRLIEDNFNKSNK